MLLKDIEGRRVTCPPVRIVWLAPWFRTLATAWAGGLRDLGHDVRVITSPMHFDPPPAHPDDVELGVQWRSAQGAREFARARRAVADFAPDVVIAEITRDPRYLGLAPRGVPLVVTTHDAVAHDRANRTPFMRRLAQEVLVRRAAVEVCFSEQVAAAVAPRSHPVRVVPLTSEMPESLTPPFVPADGRRDFLVVGRLSAYKNIPTVIEAYRRHQASERYRGDRLLLVGGGDPECEVPDDIEWVRGRFRFADLAPRLAAAKASVCLYSAGSQSGVQVTSMQCGVQCLVSDVGGLASYLPVGETALPAHDPGPLAASFDALADPEAAAAGGRRAAQAYAASMSVTATSARLEGVLHGAR